MLRIKEQKSKELQKKYENLKNSLIEWKANDNDKTFGDVCIYLGDIIQEMSGLSSRSGTPRAHFINWDDIKQHIILLFIVNKERLKGIDLDHPHWKGYITKTINFYFHRAMVGTKKVYDNTNSAGYSYNYAPKDANYVTGLNERMEEWEEFIENGDEYETKS